MAGEAADFLGSESPPKQRKPKVAGSSIVPSEAAEAAAAAKFKADADMAMGVSAEQYAEGSTAPEMPKAQPTPVVPVETAKTVVPVVMPDRSEAAGRHISFVDIEGFLPPKFTVGQSREWMSGDDSRGDPATVEELRLDESQGLVTVVLRSVEPTYNGQVQEVVAPLSRCIVAYDHPQPKELPAGIVKTGSMVKAAFLLSDDERARMVKEEGALAAKARERQLEAAGV